MKLLNTLSGYILAAALIVAMVCAVYFCAQPLPGYCNDPATVKKECML